MRAFVWTYRVRPERAEDFRRAYASSGEWARLFSRSQDYRGTKLFVDPNDTTFLMTIDSFQSPDRREFFLAENRSAYDTLDRRWRDATIEENFVGEFDVVD